MRPAQLSGLARRELNDAADWISDDSQNAAEAFVRRVAEVAVQLAEHPRSGVSRPDLAASHFRFKTIPGFAYVIVYDSRPKPPLILRALHGARDLGTLLSPLREG
jgi:toxin ParE1/3/4